LQRFERGLPLSGATPSHPPAASLPTGAVTAGRHAIQTSCLHMHVQYCPCSTVQSNYGRGTSDTGRQKLLRASGMGGLRTTPNKNLSSHAANLRAARKRNPSPGAASPGSEERAIRRRFEDTIEPLPEDPREGSQPGRTSVSRSNTETGQRGAYPRVIAWASGQIGDRPSALRDPGQFLTGGERHPHSPRSPAAGRLTPASLQHAAAAAPPRNGE